MGFQRGDGDAHPVAERESVQKTAELRFAVGAVETEGLVLVGCGGRLPKPHQVPVVSQLGCGNRLGSLSAVDLRFRGSRWDSYIELD
jgi:hypothetical protein